MSLSKKLRETIHKESGSRAVSESWKNPVLKMGPTDNPGRYPPKEKIRRAGHEIKKNPPAILAKTKRKKGRAASQKQRVAIMLDKARRE